ncbi:cytochrome P450 [Variovorax sp. OV329]|uniref:cytochrome P450 n=1 Tax=Variovorax sp. OV329 TaxID=1882825 RepID=UPI000B87EE03|nr:cytochrome P450 [Variovorax sp. OV329]
MTHEAPSDAIAAATHADPYPFYAQLRAGPPLLRDDRLGLWIASRAEVVMQVLAHPQLRVRPVAEPVPRAIVGLPAGELFSQLIRMNDGPLHAMHRPVLQRGLAGLDLRAVHSLAREVADELKADSLDDWCLAMPVSAVAALLGFHSAQWPALARWTRDFVACLSPLSSAEQLQGASQAAHELLVRFEPLMASAQPGSLLAGIQEQAARSPEVQRRVLLCNLVGLLSQTCEGTAGLLGNAIVALRREPGLHDAFTQGRVMAQDIVAEVARHDSSVQNTRRFVAEPAVVAGTALAAGDAILVLLASAQRDEALHPDPDRFDVSRSERHLLGFGHGPHACPGMALALAIAAAGLESLGRRRLADAASLPARWHYRRSVNGRLPQFSA